MLDVAFVAVTEDPDPYRRLKLRLGSRPDVEVALGLHPLRAASVRPAATGDHPAQPDDRGQMPRRRPRHPSSAPASVQIPTRGRLSPDLAPRKSASATAHESTSTNTRAAINWLQSQSGSSTRRTDCVRG